MSKIIPSSWEVPARFRARMGRNAGRQRAMVHEGHVLLVLHAVPRLGEHKREAALFWRAPDATWKSAGIAKGGVAGLRELLDSYSKALVPLEDQVEGAKRAADYFAALQVLTPLARSARNLHAALQEARDAVGDDPEVIALRDQAYEAERTAELLLSDARDGLDFRVAERSERQAETSDHIASSSHRLNLVAALFLPISALGSVFGMNFRHGFEDAYAPYLFWVVLAGAFLCGFLLRGSIARREASG